MAVAETTARENLFADMFSLINTNKLSGWTVLATFPESNPAFPCVVIHGAEVESDGLTFNRSQRDFPVTMEIEVFAKAADGLEKIDQGKDNVMATIRNNQSSLYSDKIDVPTVNDTGSSQLMFNEVKINQGGLSADIRLLL